MVKNTRNAEHYLWGKDCDGWHLLKSDTLSVIQERMPPNTFESRHYHEKAQQVFFILSGEATFLIEENELVAYANDCVHVPKGVKHQIKNQGRGDLHFLVISEPKSHGDRINV